MTLEQKAYDRIRQLGYWNYGESIATCNPKEQSCVGWSNPNATEDPDTMFQIMWLLSSTSRRQRLSSIDVRILEQSGADLMRNGKLLSATKSYVQYLWEQVYRQEFPHILSER